jgi:hypothetical protein
MPEDSNTSRFNISGSVYGAVNIGSIAQNISGNNISGDKVGEQKQTLAEAACEIQRLLKQLEKTSPAATELERIAYVNDETTPSFKRRVVSVLQSDGETAIEEFLDDPYVKVGKAIAKSWLSPE